MILTNGDCAPFSTPSSFSSPEEGIPLAHDASAAVNDSAHRIVLHRTSLERAIKIVSTGVFQTSLSSGDRGLNGLLQGDSIRRQAFVGDEVWLLFEWAGEIRDLAEPSPDFRPPPAPDDRPPNVLHREPERLWRVFIPAGTTQHLRVVGLKIEVGDKKLEDPGEEFWLRLPWAPRRFTLFRAWRRREDLLRRRSEILALLAEKPQVVVRLGGEI